MAMNKLAKLLLLLSFTLIASCADPGRSRLLSGEEVEDSPELNNSEVARLAELITNDFAPSTAYPTSNSDFHRVITYTKDQYGEFNIEIDSSVHTCTYSYSQASVETTFEKNITLNTDGEEIITYLSQTATTPIEPTYTTIPNIAEVKEACNNQIDLLNTTTDQVVLDFEKKWKSFQDLVTKMLISPLESCLTSSTISGMTCTRAKFTRNIFSEGSSFNTFAFTITYFWQFEGQETITTTQEIELSPELYYLDTLGIINLHGEIPYIDTEININFSKVESLKLSGF